MPVFAGRPNGRRAKYPLPQLRGLSDGEAPQVSKVGKYREKRGRFKSGVRQVGFAGLLGDDLALGFQQLKPTSSGSLAESEREGLREREGRTRPVFKHTLGVCLYTMTQ